MQKLHMIKPLSGMGSYTLKKGEGLQHADMKKFKNKINASGENLDLNFTEKQLISSIFY